MRRIKANNTGPALVHVSKKIRTHGGFTLVEVLVAVVLLSVGLLAVLTAGQAARETQQRAVHLAMARTIAQNKVENARVTPWDQMDMLAEPPNQDSSLPRGNTVEATIMPYTDSSGNSDPDLAQYAVTITWPEKDGTQSVCYETLIANKN